MVEQCMLATNQVAARRAAEATTSYLFGLHDHPRHSFPDLHVDRYSSVGAVITFQWT